MRAAPVVVGIDAHAGGPRPAQVAVDGVQYPLSLV